MALRQRDGRYAAGRQGELHAAVLAGVVGEVAQLDGLRLLERVVRVHCAGKHADGNLGLLLAAHPHDEGLAVVGGEVGHGDEHMAVLVHGSGLGEDVYKRQSPAFRLPQQRDG